MNRSKQYKNLNLFIISYIYINQLSHLMDMCDPEFKINISLCEKGLTINLKLCGL